MEECRPGRLSVSQACCDPVGEGRGREKAQELQEEEMPGTPTFKASDKL